MKKYKYTVPALVILGLAISIYAANNAKASAQNAPMGQEDKQVVATSQGVAVQNQTMTKNEGEDSQLNVMTQERLEDSEVGSQVRQLLETKTTGGIGDQVRQVAQDQIQAHTQIQDQLDKLDSKGKLARVLTGTDLDAVKNLKQQLEQNQLRIELLTQLKDQLFNQGDITMVEETIQALTEENTTLQDRISMEEQTKSLFGWLLRLFAR